MHENASDSRFKAEMPAIPGVSPGLRRNRSNPLSSLIVGVVVFGIVLVFAIRWFTHARPARTVHLEPAPQLEVPPPPPDPASLLPHANAANPVIARIADFAKPWSSADFFIHDLTTGENVPATIVRLPTGSAARAAGYWAFSRKAPYGSCSLEYITDMDKLRGEYDFQHATHPLVGNPCSHTLYDPLKMANIMGNVWVRGGIVQGSDVRPPLGVEIKIQSKQIEAIRTE